MADFARALRYLRPAEPQRQLFQAAPNLSLSRQLELLKSSAPGGRERAGIRREALPGGDEEITRFGRHTVMRKAYDHHYYHGKVRLGRFSRDDLSQFMAAVRHKGSVPNREGILFLDTETTGIQGGSGICPFLVGIGYFEGDDFHVVQYFIRDFDEEPSMLHALSRLGERFQMVVTYNGAAFDIPLLDARFTLARMENPFPGMVHLDLLPGARRLWRNGHGSCRLVALEKEILSFLRGPDVPGSMIPRAYFDFLQHGVSATLEGVLRHNVLDVASLAALTVTACDRVTAEPAPLDDPVDLFSLARMLEGTAEWKRAIHLYDVALTCGLPETMRQRAMESLIVLHRRAGAHERALSICEDLIAQPGFSLPAFEGAAIYYERIAGDHARALEVVELAFKRIGERTDVHRWRTQLRSRWERLRQKALGF